MSEDSNKVHDPDHSPKSALEKGLGLLERAATDLGANTLAVLVLEAGTLEIAYQWTQVAAFHPVPIDCRPEMHCALCSQSGPVSADSCVARFLTSAVAPAASSFLLFQWRALRSVVLIVFGFEGPQPAHDSLPPHVVEGLNLAACAAWSLKEVNRLRAELRNVNDRFAGRKLVERVKGILQTERGMSEEEAYEYLRKMSRQRRITMSKLAEYLLGSSHWP